MIVRRVERVANISCPLFIYVYEDGLEGEEDDRGETEGHGNGENPGQHHP